MGAPLGLGSEHEPGDHARADRGDRRPRQRRRRAARAVARVLRCGHAGDRFEQLVADRGHLGTARADDAPSDGTAQRPGEQDPREREQQHEPAGPIRMIPVDEIRVPGRHGRNGTGDGTRRTGDGTRGTGAAATELRSPSRETAPERATTSEPTQSEHLGIDAQWTVAGGLVEIAGRRAARAQPAARRLRGLEHSGRRDRRRRSLRCSPA